MMSAGDFSNEGRSEVYRGRVPLNKSHSFISSGVQSVALKAGNAEGSSAVRALPTLDSAGSTMSNTVEHVNTPPVVMLVNPLVLQAMTLRQPDMFEQASMPEFCEEGDILYDVLRNPIWELPDHRRLLHRCGDSKDGVTPVPPSSDDSATVESGSAPQQRTQTQRYLGVSNTACLMSYGVQPSLTLPNRVGVYLAQEDFKALLCFFNSATYTLSTAVCTVEYARGKGRRTLLQRIDLATLTAKSHYTCEVRVPLRQAGTYTLYVRVNYTDPSLEGRQLLWATSIAVEQPITEVARSLRRVLRMSGNDPQRNPVARDDSSMSSSKSPLHVPCAVCRSKSSTAAVYKDGTGCAPLCAVYLNVPLSHTRVYVLELQIRNSSSVRLTMTDFRFMLHNTNDNEVRGDEVREGHGRHSPVVSVLPSTMDASSRPNATITRAVASEQHSRSGHSGGENGVYEDACGAAGATLAKDLDTSRRQPVARNADLEVATSLTTIQDCCSGSPSGNATAVSATVNIDKLSQACEKEVFLESGETHTLNYLLGLNVDQLYRHMMLASSQSGSQSSSVFHHAKSDNKSDVTALNVPAQRAAVMPEWLHNVGHVVWSWRRGNGEGGQGRGADILLDKIGAVPDVEVTVQSVVPICRASTAEESDGDTDEPYQAHAPSAAFSYASSAHADRVASAPVGVDRMASDVCQGDNNARLLPSNAGGSAPGRLCRALRVGDVVRMRCRVRNRNQHGMREVALRVCAEKLAPSWLYMGPNLHPLGVLDSHRSLTFAIELMAWSCGSPTLRRASLESEDEDEEDAAKHNPSGGVVAWQQIRGDGLQIVDVHDVNVVLWPAARSLYYEAPSSSISGSANVGPLGANVAGSSSSGSIHVPEGKPLIAVEDDDYPPILCELLVV